MKKKHFYSDFISLNEVFIELENTDMSEKERIHLINIASSHLHLTIFDVVFTHLTTEDKEKFLKHVESDNYNKTWEFLKSKIEGIEEKIKKSVDTLKKELLEDIKKSKRRTK